MTVRKKDTFCKISWGFPALCVITPRSDQGCAVERTRSWRGEQAMPCVSAYVLAPWLAPPSSNRCGRSSPAVSKRGLCSHLSMTVSVIAFDGKKKKSWILTYLLCCTQTGKNTPSGHPTVCGSQSAHTFSCWFLVFLFAFALHFERDVHHTDEILLRTSI